MRNFRRNPAMNGHWANKAVASLAALGTAFAVVILSPAAVLADTAPTDPNNPQTPPTVAADSLPTVQIDGVVWQQTVIGNTVYAVGNFGTARPAGAAAGTNTVVRRNILAYDIRDGKLIATFAPTLNAQATSIAASPDGATVYVGGDFTNVNGTQVWRVAALNASTGALNTSFRPLVSAKVQTILPVGNTVYLGGEFTSVGSASRARFAAVNASNGSLLGWNPLAVGGAGRAMVMSPDGSQIILGGAFTTLNGSSNPGYGLGAVNPLTGASLPLPANTIIRSAGTKAAILSLKSDGTQFYGSGYVFGSGGNLEGAFSANWSDGQVKWIEDCHGDTYDVYPTGAALYTVGHAHYCGNIGAFPQPNPWVFHRGIAFTKAVTGTITKDPLGYFNFEGNPRPSLLNWFPNLNQGTFTGQYQGPWAVTGNSDYVVMGGEFTRVNASAQQGLVRFAVKTIAPNKVGPELTGTAFTPAVTSFASGTARITWKANWDRDNATLTYKVFRDGNTTTPIYTTSQDSTFWITPSKGYLDTGLAPGSTHSYRVFVTDPFGNEVRSPSVSVTISASGTVSNYALTVMGDGADAYWRMGQPNGTTTVSDWGGASDLLAQNGVAGGAAGAIINDADKASTFNGTTSGFASTRVAIPGPDTFTMESWVKTTTNRGGKILGFGSSATGTSSSYDRQLYMDNAGHILFGVYTGATQTLASSGTYNNGTWHHVAASLGSSGMALYVDGVRIAQRADVKSGQAYSGYWRVGGDNLNSWPAAPSSRYLNGTIDEVAIYPSELGTQALANHFTLGKTGTGNSAPIAAFSSSSVDLLASFNGSASTDSDGTIASYNWNFGDGTAAGTGVSPSHTYAAAGTYAVALTVTDNEGASNSLTKSVTVTAAPPPNQPPVAAFVASAVNLTASVDASGSTDSDGTIASYSWNFGDGTAAGSGVSSSHSYAAAGTYAVALTVTDNAGASNSLTKSVTVTAAPPQNQPPVAAFVASAVNLTASVDASGSSDPDGTIASYSWNFGDGTAAGAGVSPSHTYAAAGTYQVQLLVTDNDGSTNTLTKPVTVTAPAGAALAQDDFNRSVSSGWGTAPVGGSWTVSGTAANYSVSGGEGIFSVTAAASSRQATLSGVSSSDMDMTVKTSLDQVANGGGTYVYLVGRQVTSANDYRAKIQIAAGGGVSLYLARNVAGAETTMAALNVAGLNYAAGEQLQIRMQATGVSPTTLRAKVWKVGAAEPAAWQLTTTDATAALQAAGGISLRAYVSGSATNLPIAVRFDDLLVENLGLAG